MSLELREYGRDFRLVRRLQKGLEGQRVLRIVGLEGGIIIDAALPICRYFSVNSFERSSFSLQSSPQLKRRSGTRTDRFSGGRACAVWRETMKKKGDQKTDDERA